MARHRYYAAGPGLVRRVLGFGWRHPYIAIWLAAAAGLVITVTARGGGVIRVFGLVRFVDGQDAGMAGPGGMSPCVPGPGDPGGLARVAGGVSTSPRPTGPAAALACAAGVCAGRGRPPVDAEPGPDQHVLGGEGQHGPPPLQYGVTLPLGGTMVETWDYEKLGCSTYRASGDSWNEVWGEPQEVGSGEYKTLPAAKLAARSWLAKGADAFNIRRGIYVDDPIRDDVYGVVSNATWDQDEDWALFGEAAGDRIEWGSAL